MEITVNSQKIPDTAFEQEMRRLRAAEPGLTDKQATERTQNALIDQILLQQEAEEKIPKVAPSEVDEEFNRLLERYGGAKYFYQRNNLTKKDDPRVKDDIEQSMKVQRLIDRITASVPKPAEEEIRSHYESNRSIFIQPEMVRAAHVVMTPDRSQPLETQRSMVEIRGKLMAGADFAAVADEYSGCSDAGGDLGLFARGKMVEEFETVVFSMEPGEISPVFQTQFGYHIAKVFEKTAERSQTYEEACHRIVDERLAEAKDKALRAWLKAKRKKATVEISE